MEKITSEEYLKEREEYMGGIWYVQTDEAKEYSQLVLREELQSLVREMEERKRAAGVYGMTLDEKRGIDHAIHILKERIKGS